MPPFTLIAIQAESPKYLSPDAFKTSSFNTIKLDASLLNRPHTFLGEIHYPKAPGKMGAGSGKAFLVSIYTVEKHDPTGFVEVPVKGAIVQQPFNPKSMGDVYAFPFSISGIPYDVELYVSVHENPNTNVKAPKPPGMTGPIGFAPFNTVMVYLTSAKPFIHDIVFNSVLNADL